MQYLKISKLDFMDSQTYRTFTWRNLENLLRKQGYEFAFDPREESLTILLREPMDRFRVGDLLPIPKMTYFDGKKEGVFRPAKRQVWGMSSRNVIINPKTGKGMTAKRFIKQVKKMRGLRGGSIEVLM